MRPIGCIELLYFFFMPSSTITLASLASSQAIS
jgi:hypothetical protein